MPNVLVRGTLFFSRVYTKGNLVGGGGEGGTLFCLLLVYWVVLRI